MAESVFITKYDNTVFLIPITLAPFSTMKISLFTKITVFFCTGTKRFGYRIYGWFFYAGTKQN